jgi:hypothetical protein
MTPDLAPGPDIEWRSPRRCASGECLQVAQHKQEILLRSSAAPQMIIRLSPAEWETFRAAVISGDFDDLG